MCRGAAGCDVFDPGSQVAQAPGGVVEQRWRGRALTGKVVVVELFAGPRGVTESLQPDHARAALQGVEGAPQGGRQRQVRRGQNPGGLRRRGVVKYLVSLFEEDLAHFVVLRQFLGGRGLIRRSAHARTCTRRRADPAQAEVERDRRPDAAALGARSSGEFRLQAERVGGGGDEVAQRLREFTSHHRHARRPLGLIQAFLSPLHRGGQRRLVGSLRFMRQALQVAGHVGGRDIVARRGKRQRLRLFDQPLLDRRGAGPRTQGQRAITAPHHGTQRAGVGVVGEQRLGHLRLHAEHVDQESERAQVAGKPFEDAGLHHALRIDFGRGQPIDLVTHAQQCGRGLVHAEHRQHAAHRRQLVRHRDQHGPVVGLAEELVDQLLGLGQRGAQLLHHAAHRLTVGDAPVQLFHPAFERLGRLALAHAGQPLGQPAHARRLLGVVEVAVFEHGVDIQQAGRHFHRQRSRRRDAALLGLRNRLLQLGRERLAEREQLLQRFADQRKLFRQACEPVHLAAGHGRPRFLRGRDALARLRHHGRVEAPEHADAVVGRRVVHQTVSLTRGGQPRCLAAVARRGTLGAEKQQVLSEPLRDLGVAAFKDAELRQQPRRHTLAEHVEAEQAVGLRFEDGRGELPQGRDLQVLRTGAEAGADVAHAARRRHRFGAAQKGQQLGFERGVGHGVGLARRGVYVDRQLAPVPVDKPQVGGVDAVGAGRLLDRAVLREQGQRRDRLAGQHAPEVIEQRERSALEVVNDAGGQPLRLADEALHGRLAGTQHRRRCRQRDQLQRAHALVNLGARAAQHGRVDGVDVGAGQRLGVSDETPQRLVRCFQRAAQFFVNPGQGAQVIARLDRGRVRAGVRGRVGHRFRLLVWLNREQGAAATASGRVAARGSQGSHDLRE